MESTASSINPVARTRRTRSDILQLCDGIHHVVSQLRPMTVRQVFYQLVKLGLVDKTESGYNHVVVRLLTKLRLEGELPWEWIADSTRWMRKPTTYDDIEDALRDTAATYRRALWRDQEVYVEVWLEKEALAGVLLGVTAEWDVPLMVTRGFASLSYLHSAAETIAHSVEVDALDPDDLRGLVRDRVAQHVDSDRLRALKAAEESERRLLGGLPAMLRADASRDQREPASSQSAATAAGSSDGRSTPRSEASRSIASKCER